MKKFRFILLYLSINYYSRRSLYFQLITFGNYRSLFSIDYYKTVGYANGKPYQESTTLIIYLFFMKVFGKVARKELED